MNLHNTHEVRQMQSPKRIFMGSFQECKDYIDNETESFLTGPFLIGENELEGANQIEIDDLKEECFNACKLVNPTIPSHAAAAYPEIIRSFTTLIGILEELNPSYSNDSPIAKAKSALELATK